MDETGAVIAFWVLTVVTLGSALMIAFVRDLVHAVMFLILSFVGIAGLYITLSADFVAMVQILIYAGAIAVLMIFAILLTPESARDNAAVSYRAPLGIVAGLLGATMVFVALATDWRTPDREGFPTTAADIGKALLDPYALPFEVASVLLVIAMVGAIVLVRPREEEPEP